MSPLNNRTLYSMKVSINGKTHELTASRPLSGIIQDICKNNPYVIAELNGEIIHKERWTHVNICEGDRIELISFVGGG